MKARSIRRAWPRSRQRCTRRAAMKFRSETPSAWARPPDASADRSRRERVFPWRSSPDTSMTPMVRRWRISTPSLEMGVRCSMPLSAGWADVRMRRVRPEMSRLKIWSTCSDGMGVETGVDLDRLIAAGAFISRANCWARDPTQSARGESARLATCAAEIPARSAESCGSVLAWTSLARHIRARVPPVSVPPASRHR